MSTSLVGFLQHFYSSRTVSSPDRPGPPLLCSSASVPDTLSFLCSMSLIDTDSLVRLANSAPGVAAKVKRGAAHQLKYLAEGFNQNGQLRRITSSKKKKTEHQKGAAREKAAYDLQMPVRSLKNETCDLYAQRAHGSPFLPLPIHSSYIADGRRGVSLVVLCA